MVLGMKPRLRVLRLLFAMLSGVFLAACSGSGCSNGCARSGATPLPNGFKKENTIENAASARITRSGLDFLAQHLPHVASRAIQAKNGIITFEIPKREQTKTILLFDYQIHICPNGPNHGIDPPECVVEINFEGMKLQLDAVTPHAIQISGTIAARLRDLPVSADVLGDLDVGLGSGSCGNNGLPNFDYKDIPIHVALPMIKDTVAPHEGYTKVDANNAVVEVTLDRNDVALCKDCGIGSGVCTDILAVIGDQAFDSLASGISDTLKSALKTSFCTKPIPNVTPGCPTGSHPDSTHELCVYDQDENTCVPSELGTDGHLDLSSALRNISPGTKGGLDFGVAAGGDMTPAPGSPPDDRSYPGHTPNGLTIAFLGGILPAPQSSCIPKFDNTPPIGIPIPDEMFRDQETPWPALDPTGPHFGIALAGRYLNHALGATYHSGLLCLGISTEQVPLLQSGLISALVPSFRKLTFEARGAPVAITTRPQAPPTVKIGGGTDTKRDPHLLVRLPSFNIDFYVWSDDRFVRVFTLTADMTVPVTLQTGKDPKKNPSGGILPVLGDISLENAKVENSELLLTEDKAALTTALQAILQSFVGVAGSGLGGKLKTLDPSSSLESLGLTLTIPEGGIRKLHKGNDDYLSIFADFGTPTTNAIVQTDTRAALVKKTVYAEAMGLMTAREDKMPELEVLLSSSLENVPGPVEYSYWIDESSHSAWSREDDASHQKMLFVRDRYLFLQGKHTLYVSSRVIGQPDTEDSTPAEVPFAIDVLAPSVHLTRDEDEAVHVAAWDIVSGEDSLRGRYRTKGTSGVLSGWTDWKPLAAMAQVHVPDAESIDVEVSDEEGNVASVSQALIRGRGDSTLTAGGSGCGCAMWGVRRSSICEAAASFAVLGALFTMVGRRRGGQRVRRLADHGN